MNKDERLVKRTDEINARKGRILIRREHGYPVGINIYLDMWSNLAAPFEQSTWTENKNQALNITNLWIAHAVAKVYHAKVVVVYPRKSFPHDQVSAIGAMIERKLAEKRRQTT
jgi:hypothetical protein